MTQVLVTESSLENIADAIRYKLQVGTVYTPSEMADAIMAIVTEESALTDVSYSNRVFSKTINGTTSTVFTADATPTNGSNNPVTSDGVYDALATKQDTLSFDAAPASGSSNPVTSDGIYDALATKQDTLTIDATPTDGSNNPVASNGVYDALATKQDTLTFDNTPTENSANPVTSDGIYDSVSQLNNHITDIEDRLGAVRYGIKIDKSDSDPNTRITYIYDAVGMIPAEMGASTFSYGTWESTPLVQSNYPCMVLYNGTEDYKLDPTDLTKKLDGTASDVADTTYGGNAMAAFKGGWLSQFEDEEYEYIIWSNVQYDSSYQCYHRMDSSGNVRPGFYWNIYPTSLVDSKARSISGQTPMASKTASNERTYCQANGDEWGMTDWSKWNYIMALLSIIGCSDDLQTTFGQGNSTSGSALSGGELNTYGAFYGDISGTTSAVKVFNIEHLWGNQWTRLLGMITVDGKLYISPYGPYDLTASDESYVEMVAACASVGWVAQTSTTQYGRITETVGGSSSTYRCDYYYINLSGTRVAVVGGGNTSGSGCGSSVYLDFVASTGTSGIAPGLSAKMLNS